MVCGLSVHGIYIYIFQTDSIVYTYVYMHVNMYMCVYLRNTPSPTHTVGYHFLVVSYMEYLLNEWVLNRTLSICTAYGVGKDFQSVTPNLLLNCVTYAKP